MVDIMQNPPKYKKDIQEFILHYTLSTTFCKMIYRIFLNYNALVNLWFLLKQRSTKQNSL